MASKSFSVLSLASFAFCLVSFVATVHVSYNGRALKIDGERKLSYIIWLYSLSTNIHYFVLFVDI